jgi:hypothetical protein
MNFNYKDITEMLETKEIDIHHESYIERALKDYGFEKFPESGLEDRAAITLVNRVIDLEHADALLIRIKPETSGKFGAQTVKEKLGKVEKIVKDAVMGMIRAGAEIPVIFPSAYRRLIEKDTSISSMITQYFLGIFLGTLTTSYTYSQLSQNNSEIIPYILGTQIATNLISGIYEWRRVERKKAKEADEILVKYNVLGETSPSRTISKKRGDRKKCGHKCNVCNNRSCPDCYAKKDTSPSGMKIWKHHIID